MASQNLQTHRQAFGCVSTRYAHTRNSCQRSRNRVDIGEIHRHRVRYFFADFESRERRNRRDDGVYFLKCLREILSDQTPYALGFQVISIVVAGAQYISP